jgi:hypothetical protein
MSGTDPAEASTATPMEKALAVKQAHAHELLAKANVVGVGVGLRQKNGEYTDTVALVVVVQRKVGMEELTEADCVPREIDGIQVDVQEVGDIQI